MFHLDLEGRVNTVNFAEEVEFDGVLVNVSSVFLPQLRPLSETR